jgi:fructosamine-3-kinase
MERFARALLVSSSVVLLGSARYALVSAFAPESFQRRGLASLQMSSSADYMDVLSKTVSDALDRPVTLKPASGGGYSGGGGATTSAVVDQEDTKYFVKAASGGHDMLRAEYLGVKEMSETKTIRVPTPVCFGDFQNRAFAVFEYLEFKGGGSQYELGQKLAQMHRCVSDKAFGFHVDNTIGATHQPNTPWMENWADFWDEHRLGHMLRLTGNAGLANSKIEELRTKTRELLSHNPAPSLVHGDLWGGNKAFCQDGEKVVPVIFDPATYYGDREVDVAMTYVFGGFNGDFYEGYESEWPLPAGHEKRRTVYNLFHILNHDILFGGMYLRQAQGMIDQILRL